MKKFFVTLVFSTTLSGTTHDTQNLHRYFMANYYQFGNNLKNAGKWYAQMGDNKTNPYIYTGYIPYLAAAGAYQEIVRLIPTLDEQYSSNDEMQLLFATALEQTGNKIAAYDRLIKLNQKNKTNQELAFKVTQIYLERSEPENALKVIDSVLNNAARRPNNYIFYFLKSQIYLSLNNKKEALAAVKQCIDVYPRFDKSWLLYAMLLEQEGKLEDAIKGYQRFLDVTSDPKGHIQRHVMSLSYRTKLTQKSTDLDSLDDLLAQKNYRAAHATVDAYLQAHPHDIYTRLLKIQILMDQAHYGSAAHLLEQWMLEKDNLALYAQTLHLLTYIGMPLPTAKSTFDALEKKAGTSEMIALYQADIALRMNDQKLAITALSKAHAHASDAYVKTTIAYQLAHTYYDQKEWKKAQEILELAITSYVDYAPAQNLLAYIYTTKTNQFERAQKAIEKALLLDPQNPHYLDTKAVLLAAQKQYEPALKIWNTINTPDFKIACHQGKCYMRTGNKEQAAASFQKALDLAANKEQKQKVQILLAETIK